MSTITSLGFSLFARSMMKKGLNKAAKEIDTFAGRTIAKGREISDAMAPISVAGGAAAAAGLGKSFADGLNLDAAQATLTAQLNLSEKESARVGKVAGRVFSDNYGSSVEDVQRAIRGVGSNIADLGEVSDRELTKMSKSALGLANIMGEDVSRVTRGVGQLMRNNLAKDGQQGFDLITRAAQRLPEEMQGELLDVIEEYSADFTQLGLNGAQSLGMITAAVQNGARNIDVAADAIREFSIRAINGSDLTAGAFQDLGFNAGTMSARIAEGGPAATAAMSEVIQALGRIKDPLKQEEVGVALFGTRWEEAGAAAILAMDPAAASLRDVAGATDAASKAMQGSAMEQFSAAWRSLTGTLSEKLLPSLTRLASWMVDHPGTVAVISVALVGLVGTLLLVATVVGPLVTTVGLATKAWAAWTAGSWALNASFLANPLTWIVIAIVALVAAVVVAWIKFEGFRTAVMAVWDGIKAGWSALWDGVLKPGLDALLAWWEQTWPKIASIALQAWAAIQTYFAEITPKIREIFGQVALIVTAVLDVITGLWSEHGSTVLGVLSGMWTTVWGILQGAFVIVVALVKGGWQAVAGIFSGLLSVISGILNVFIGLFTGDWGRMWEGVKQIFTGLWTAIVGIFTGAVTIVVGIAKGLYTAVVQPFVNLYNYLVGNSLIPDLVNGITRWFTSLRDRAAAIWAAVRDWVVSRAVGLRDRVVSAVLALRNRALATFTNLRDRARGIWDSVRDWIVSRATSLRDRVYNAVNTLRGRVIGAFERARDGVKKAWDRLQGIAKAPVKFVIQTVYNAGIVPLWNKVADKVPGMRDLTKMSLPKGFARGGILGGRSSWRGGDTHLRPMREGEGVYVSEAMRDPYERARLHAINKAAMQGKDLSRFRDYQVSGVSATQLGQPPIDGFARGGIIGSWLADKWDAVVGKAKEWATAPLNALRDRLKNEYGSGQNFRGIPYHVLQLIRSRILERFGKADSDHAASMAGGADSWVGLESASTRLQRTARWARAQHGKPYIWGGAGPRGYDCSGFMGAIENKIRGVGPYFRRYSTHAFRGSSAPSGWVRNLSSPFSVGITHAGVGHTGGTLMGVNVESRGSRGVVVGSGARGTRSSLFGSRYGFAPVARDATAGSKRTSGGGGTAAVFDNGGTLAPGLNLVDNRTGGPEALRRADQQPEVHYHFDFRGAVITGGAKQIETMVVEAITEAERKGRLPKRVRR